MKLLRNNYYISITLNFMSYSTNVNARHSQSHTIYVTSDHLTTTQELAAPSSPKLLLSNITVRMQRKGKRVNSEETFVFIRSRFFLWFSWQHENVD